MISSWSAGIGEDKFLCPFIPRDDGVGERARNANSQWSEIRVYPAPPTRRDGRTLRRRLYMDA